MHLSALNIFDPTVWIFMKVDIWRFLKNLLKIQVSLISDKNKGYCNVKSNLHLIYLVQFFT